ncbi:Fic family protein [Alteromonas stellipolaris]|uniref:Fic family protein n=1 Tax=Alteromonas stellipolaris TaxID=233316 RepID=UPI0027326141|nr:Fic family protein [Alteromonas stellipolaris]MDP2537273.1 Fic family protein [Alteromonas stellipolaris]
MNNQSLTTIIDNFPLSSINKRFLCGGSALRDARYVSRMRLCLALEGVGDADILAELLISDIKRYESAKAFISSKKRLTIKDLLIAHKKLLPDDSHAGKLRTGQGWIGRSRKSATYIPPPAEQVISLLNNFIIKLNNFEKLSTEDVIKFYCEFLTIHPFWDGNGRMSRILVDYMQKKADVKTHFSLFRLGMEISDYQDAVLSFGIRSNLGVKCPYWQNMLGWISVYEAKVQAAVNDLKNLLAAKLILYPLSTIDLEVVIFLLKQPVVTLNSISQKLNIDFNNTKVSISKLVSAKVLTPYKTKNAPNCEVFVCRDVCQLMIKLDDLLFCSKVFK